MTLSALVLADAVSEATGSMSLVDGTFITAMFSGMAAIITAIGTIMWKNRRANRQADSGDESFVTRAECRNHRCTIDKRIDGLYPMLEKIFNRLAENDERDETRINGVQRRIDPLIEKLASTAAEVEMLKTKGS